MRTRTGHFGRSVAFLVCLTHASLAGAAEHDVESAREGWECTLGEECERWGPLLEDAGGTSVTCLASGAPPTPPIWYQLLEDPPCPFGRCKVYDQQLTLDADGSLITLGAVLLPLQRGDVREGGLWFTRHAPGGALRASALWDFSIPPPGIAVERHGALLRDRAGRAVFVSSRALVPFDAPRPLEATWISRGARPSSTPFFSTPNAWGVKAVLSPSGDWLVASQRAIAGSGSQASITRYTRHGAVLWRRTWPAGSAIEAVQATHDQAILALASDATTATRTLYKLDERGIVAWRTLVETSFEPVQVATAGDGAIYVVTLLPTEFLLDVRIQRLAPDGARSAAWVLPNTYAVPTLGSGDSGEIMLVLGSFDSQGLPTLDWYAFEGDVCRGTSYVWPNSFSAIPERVAVYADRRGARFFATLEVIGQLRERGQP